MAPCPLVFDAAWFLAQAKKQKVSHAVIGDALGLERSAATKVLNGVRPIKLDYIPALARLLRVSRTEIIKRCGLPLEGDSDSLSQPEVQSHV